MLKMFSMLKETDADSNYFRKWVSNTQDFHGAVFGYVESLIVLGALQFAAYATSSWIVWGLYFIGYGTLIVLTSVYFRSALMLLVNRLGIKGWGRHAALWLSGICAIALNTWLVGALSQALSELVSAGLAS